LEKVIEGVTRW